MFNKFNVVYKKQKKKTKIKETKFIKSKTKKKERIYQKYNLNQGNLKWKIYPSRFVLY